MGDIKKRFSTGEPLMDRYGLPYYYGRSMEPGTIVLVMQDGEEIAGMTLLVIGKGSLTIEMLARNRHSGIHGAGKQMLNFIEERLAVQLGIQEIRLESLNREKLVDFYLKNGFVRYGGPYFDREWGILFPMRKRILSLEN